MEEVLKASQLGATGGGNSIGEDTSYDNPVENPEDPRGLHQFFPRMRRFVTSMALSNGDGLPPSLRMVQGGIRRR
jgi:hypothetical protein